MRLVNVLLAVLNVITGALGLAALGAGIWLLVKGGTVTECRKLGQWVALVGGAAILLIAAAGAWAAWRRLRWLLRIYCAILIVVAAALAAITIVAVVMTRTGPNSGASSPAHLSDYHSWLQRTIVSPHYWNKIESCLVDVKLCNKASKLTSAAAFDNLPLLQSGCCKPPAACNLTFVNGTTWDSIKGSSHIDADTDCSLWANGQSRLCFACDSCKTAILQTARRKWKDVAIFGAAIVFYVILILLLASCAISSCCYGEDEEEEEEEEVDRRRYPPGTAGRGFYVNKA